MTISDRERTNDPRSVDDGPARPAVERGEGVTATERYLVGLAERSFLNLWCYPNAFIDKKSGGKGDGKELCDLLVVCGDHVLIFSDKAVDWPGGDNVSLAWSRWYRRAIQKSVNQIRGAQRWVEKFPDRVFIDKACSQRLPLTLPSPDRIKVHGIVVANGAAKACRKHFAGGIGSLMIVPDIKDKAHCSEDNLQPFAIGDIDSGGPFVHVFDEATLDIVMGELDTISDLTGYLAKKEALIRSGKLVSATGEEELVAQYMIRMNAEGEHDFTKPDGSPWGEHDRVTYGSGAYTGLTKNPVYLAKKKADKISYAWDNLITLFTDRMLAGTTLVPDDQATDLAAQEIPVRHMALVPRFLRRNFGQFVVDALEEGQKADKFMRFFHLNPEHTIPEVGFFIVTVKVPTFKLDGGYQQYRLLRRRVLEAYALVLLRKNVQLRAVVGFATEPKPPNGEKPGSSEDLVYTEQPEWNDGLLESLATAKRLFGIGQPGKTRARNFSAKEYPDRNAAPESRQVRRARERRAKKAARPRKRKDQ